MTAIRTPAFPPSMRPPSWPAWAQDQLWSETTVTLDWLDRLRVLWHGTIHVRVGSYTEHPPGKTEGRSRAWAPRVGIERLFDHEHEMQASPEAPR